MKFTPVSVPLTSGLKLDVGSLAQVAVNQLARAENVVYTRRGEIRGRPGMTAHGSEQVQTVDNASFPTTGPTTTLTSAVTGLVRAGIDALPSKIGRFRPAALYQSRAFARGDDQWLDVGPFWSVRKQVSEDLAPTQAATKRIPCGDKLVGIQVTNFAAGGMPYLNSAGTGEGYSSYDSAFDSTAQGNVWVVNVSGKDFVYYVTAGGSLNLITPGTFPASSTATLDTTVKTTPQLTCAVACESGLTSVVAYVKTGTATQVTLKRVNASGTVTHTTTLATVYGTVQALSIGWDNSQGLVLAVGDSTGNVHTRIISVSSGGFTDVGLAKDIVNSIGSVLNALATGCNGTGTAWVAWDDGTSIQYATRSMTAATSTTVRSMLTSGSASFPPAVSSVNYTLLFQPILFCGRMVLGVSQTSIANSATSGTFLPDKWAVLDVTEAAGNNQRPVVAVSATAVPGVFGGAFVKSGYDANDTLQFGAFEGHQFDTLGPSTWAAVRIKLTAQAARGVTVGGQTFFSGATPYVLSGRACVEAGWVDGQPSIISVTAAAGGSLSNGSYSLQAIWTYTNGAGRVVRSVPSPVYTLTVGASQKVSAVISAPQLQNPLTEFITSIDGPKVELYMTVVNPTAGADLYLVATAQANQGTGTVTISNVGASSDTNTTKLKLYTGGGVIPDEPPPAGDRGVASAVGRLWVADARKVYASKLIGTVYAPAWSTIGFLTVEIPHEVGEINALASMDDKLVVICSGGLCVVTGAGFDDLGNGSGFSVEVYNAPGGAASPRGVAEAPDGVFYMGIDGDLKLLTRGLTVVNVARPARGYSSFGLDQDPVPAECDVTFLPAAGGISESGLASKPPANNAALFGGRRSSSLRYLDMEFGNWAGWQNSGDGTAGSGETEYHTAVGDTLWAQTNANVVGDVISWDRTDGKDLGVNFLMLITTGTISPGDPNSDTTNEAHGRLRGVTISGSPLGNHTLSCTATAGQDNNATLVNKQFSVGADPVKLPGNQVEFRCTQQRFDVAQATVYASPALAVWSELVLEIARLPGRFPSRNRL